MSTHAVEIAEILSIQPHPNADRLELATVKGWNCVVPKGEFKAGDSCIYIPIDSVLPETIEAKIFGADSKIKLTNRRVKTIKLRGAISQGLIVAPSTFDLERTKTGTDVTKTLGVTKYEPPSAPSGMNTAKAQTSYKQTNPPGEVVYGEVYGDGIQKGYTYGCGPGQRKLVLFDVMVNGEYLDPLAFQKWADARGFETAPVLFKGAFDREAVKALTVGASVLAPAQKVREGVVVKPMREATTYIGRKVLKFISDEYLLRDSTDFH